MTSTIRHTIVFAAVFMQAPLAIDMYLPALPSIARDLNTGIDQVEATVAILLLGYALGQLVLGPLSDRYGRLSVLQGGLVVFAVSSLAAGVAQSIEQLYVIRLFQAFGGAASVVVFPMVRDRYDEREGGKVISYIMAGVVVAPLVAPLAGAWIMAVAGWPAIFFALGAMGVLALGAVRVVLKPAGSSAARREAFSLGSVLAGYRRVLGDRRTMAHVLAGALGFAGLFAFVAGSPFVYMTYYGVSPQSYGWLVGLNATAMIAANVINAQLIAKMDPSVKMAIGAFLLAAAGLALVLASAAGLGLAWIVAGVVAYVGALGLTSTNSIVGALSSMPEEAGTVSALIGAAQFAIGSISSLAISLMASTSATTMTLVMAVCGIGSLLAALSLRGANELQKGTSNA